MSRNYHCESLEKNIESILITEQQIEEMTDRLSADISSAYENTIAEGNKLVLLTILKGSVLFSADLVKKITVPAEMEFMKVSSYGAGTKSSGEIRIHLDLVREDLSNLDILVIEDIVDSGRTLFRLTQMLRNRGAHSVKTVTMLDKPSRREVEFKPDFCGFEIPDMFVVGYGLDYQEEYRTLPYVGVLKPSVYTK